jgi:hypothetical protein
MNLRHILLMGAVGSVALAAAACHDNDNGSPASTPPVSNNSSAMALDTAQVLVLAQQASETGTPFAVNGGELTLTDTSETSAPIGVNQ